MLKPYQQNKIVFIVYTTIIIFCACISLIYSKSDIHIFINERHNRILDYFLKYITYLGDGRFLILLTVVFVFIRYRISLTLFLSYLLSGICVQILKRIFFLDMDRPAKVLRHIYDLYLIDGIDIKLYKSFPSGHSATAFALFVVLIFFIKSNYAKTIFLIIAFIVAYSRMYLSQHFLIDVWVGSLIGFLSAVFIYLYIYKLDYIWLDSSLLRKLKNGKK